MDGESRLWLDLLKEKSPQSIEQGFKDHFANPDSGRFFPKPADILAQIENRRLAQEAIVDAERTDAYLAELRHTREQLAAQGLPSGAKQYAQTIEMVKETASKVGPPLKPMPAERTKAQEIVITAERRNLLQQQLETILRSTK